MNIRKSMGSMESLGFKRSMKSVESRSHWSQWRQWSQWYGSFSFVRGTPEIHKKKKITSRVFHVVPLTCGRTLHHHLAFERAAPDISHRQEPVLWYFSMASQVSSPFWWVSYLRLNVIGALFVFIFDGVSRVIPFDECRTWTSSFPSVSSLHVQRLSQMDFLRVQPNSLKLHPIFMRSS